MTDNHTVSGDSAFLHVRLKASFVPQDNLPFGCLIALPSSCFTPIILEFLGLFISVCSLHLLPSDRGKYTVLLLLQLLPRTPAHYFQEIIKEHVKCISESNYL